ncbi:MAG TPA: DUF5060 domain-containing protein, partial [Planctomycetes bacterium]|nr:DUF5060 domain-containing protein [Planctomycetota bacterium]
MRRAFLFQDYAASASRVISPQDIVPVGPVRWRIVWKENVAGRYLYSVKLPQGGAAHGEFSTAGIKETPLPPLASAGDVPLAFYRVSLPGTAALYSPDKGSWQVQPSAVLPDAHARREAWFIPLEWYAGWGSWNGPGIYDLRLAYIADLALLQTTAAPLPVVILSDSELDDHGTFRWGVSPLNSLNGGPLTNPYSLFLSAAAMSQVCARAAYVADRWGDFPSVSGITFSVTTLTGLAPSWHKRLADALGELGVIPRLPLTSSSRMAIHPRSTLLLASFEGPGEALQPQKPPQRDGGPAFSAVTGTASHGRRALGLARSTASDVPLEALFSGGLSLGDHRHIAVDVRMPDDAPAAGRIQFYIRDGDYGWYEFLSPELLLPGDWVTVTAPLDDVDAWTKHGRCPDYNPYTRQDVKEIGVRIFPNGTFQGTVLLDNLHCFTLADEIPYPLRIIDLKLSGDAFTVWDKVEYSFDIARPFSNPFDPEVVDVSADFVLPDGRIFTMPGFFHQDFVRSIGPDREEVLAPSGRPYWKIRFAPPVPGHYKATLTVSADRGREVARAELPSFTAAPDGGGRRGPVRVLSSGAFGFADGSAMYPVGMNLRSPSDSRDAPRDPGILPLVKLAELRKTYQYDDYFAAFEKTGLNWARVWMCSWWLALEWYRKWPGFRGAGYYNLANAWRLDHLLDEAARRNIFLQLELINHGQVSTRIDHEWEYHPYNYYEPEAYVPASRVTDKELVLLPHAEDFRRPAGFLKDPEDFFTDERARRLTRNRLRYTVARWGYSQHVFAWVLMSEVEFTGEYWKHGYDKGERSPKTAAWHREMAAYLKEIDPYKHIVSTHFSHPHRGQDVWALKELDFIQSNAYSTFPWFGGRGMDREQ